MQIEQVSQLSSLVESQLQYHRQAVQVLEELFDKLRDRYVYEEEKQTWCLSECAVLLLLTSQISVRETYLRVFFFFNRMNEAQNRPRREYTPKPKPIFDFGDVNHSNGGYTTSMAPPPSRNSGKKQDKCL